MGKEARRPSVDPRTPPASSRGGPAAVSISRRAGFRLRRAAIKRNARDLPCPFGEAGRAALQSTRPGEPGSGAPRASRWHCPDYFSFISCSIFFAIWPCPSQLISRLPQFLSVHLGQAGYPDTYARCHLRLSADLPGHSTFQIIPYLGLFFHRMDLFNARKENMGRREWSVPVGDQPCPLFFKSTSRLPITFWIIEGAHPNHSFPSVLIPSMLYFFSKRANQLCISWSEIIHGFIFFVFPPDSQ